jgi:hypothetical protein
MKLSDFAAELQSKPNPETPQSCIVYGAPKSGKTTLVAQLARKYKVIWIDTEHGFQTLFSALPKEFWPNVELIVVKDTQDFPRAVRMLTKLFKAQTPVKICREHGDIACALCIKVTDSITIDPKTLDSGTVLVVDSLTQLSDSAMAHALGISGELVFKKKEYSHWDNQGLMLKGILTSQQRFPCHTVFISHEEELPQEDGTKKLTPVGGSRNFSPTVARYFDHVVYTSVRNKRHCVNSCTTGDIRVQAGSRNQVDIKSADDFIKIFNINYSEQGKKATLSFSAESEVMAQIEKEAADKVTTE